MTVKTGRKTKLTRELITGIYERIKFGIPEKHAASLNGISESTYHSWKSQAQAILVRVLDATKEGKELELSPHEELLLEFLESVARGVAECVLAGVTNIKKEAGGWKWLLGRLFPQEFGDRVEFAGLDNVKLQIELPGMGPNAEKIDDPVTAPLLGDGAVDLEFSPEVGGEDG